MLSPSNENCWYAARIISGKSIVLEYFKKEHIETYTAGVVPNLLFVRCTLKDIYLSREVLVDRLFYYKNPDHTAAQVVDEKQLKMFILLTSAKGEELVTLDPDSDPMFFKGQRVRVKAGPFEGAEGVIKRVKGDRRLLVHIPGIVAVATSYIHPGLLEPIDE